MPTSQPRLLRDQAVLALAAFVAILPILVQGPSCGHDFDFHILSWLEAANQFAHFGYPHWAYTPAFNAGEPRFLFYPPLSWTLGATLGLVLPWNLVPAAFTWVALTLSGLTMHSLARRYASPSAALIAATLYLANPYMLFSAYERTAYGELLAAAWLPLLFAAALQPLGLAWGFSPTNKAEKMTGASAPDLPPNSQRDVVRPAFFPILRIAIPLTLLWLTNAPAAVMGSYALAFLTLTRLCIQRRSNPHSLIPNPLLLALTTTAGTLLGLALAAFYIVPAAWEQRFVQVNMAVIPGMRPSEHFLFHRMGGNTFDVLFHDQVVRTASLVALTLLAAIAAAALLSLIPRTKSPVDAILPGAPPSATVSSSLRVGGSGTILPLFLLTLLIAFLLTPPSLFLWNHIPKLAFLQFPWRLSALLAVILATTVAIALNRLPKIPIPYSLLPIPLSLVLVFPAWHLFRQPCDPEDTVSARVALFHSSRGTDATDEYTPIHADGDALKPGDPPFWLVPTQSPDAPAPAESSSRPSPGPAPNHLVLQVPAPEDLVLNRRAYPTWKITLNGQSVTNLPDREDGLIVLPVPAGADTIDLTPTQTPDQTLGLSISALAVLTSVGIALKRNKLSA
jgi:hypothetical protein